MMLNGWLKNTTDMETKFNFNSQIATSRSQSERLLALGLKKETADMCWTKMARINVTFYVPELAPINMVSWRHTPAWSLHRLMSMLTTKRKCLLIRVEADLYDVLINRIEHEIKEGYFPKEYLEE